MIYMSEIEEDKDRTCNINRKVGSDEIWQRNKRKKKRGESNVSTKRRGETAGHRVKQCFVFPTLCTEKWEKAMEMAMGLCFCVWTLKRRSEFVADRFESGENEW